MGQNRSFMCSQVDSLTPENGAAKTDLPVQSNKKWRIVPTSAVMEKPISSQRWMDRFIGSPVKAEVIFI